MAISQVFAALAGYALLKLFMFWEKLSAPWPERVALSYVTGMGAIALYMAALSSLGIGYSVRVIYGPWLILIVISVLWRRGGRKTSSTVKLPYSVSEKLMFAAVVFEVFHSFFRALIKPIESFDSVASFAIKARVFFFYKGIPHDFFHDIAQRFPHPGYPLMIPLQETFVFLSMGSFNDLLVKTIFPAHFLALLVLFYFGIKDTMGRRCAVVFTFILAGINELNRFSTMGYSDVHFALYVSIGFIYWFRYMTSQDRNRTVLLWLSGVFTAFAIFTKDIGIALPFIYALMAIVRAKKGSSKAFRDYAGFLAAAFLVISPWIALKLSQHSLFPALTGAFPLLPAKGYLSNIWPIIYEFQTNVFGIKRWNLLWIVFLILFILNYRWSFKKDSVYITVFLTSMFGLMFLFYLIAGQSYFGSGRYYAFGLRSGMGRHLLCFAPVAIFWLSYLFEKMCDEKT